VSPALYLEDKKVSKKQKDKPHASLNKIHCLSITMLIFSYSSHNFSFHFSGLKNIFQLKIILPQNIKAHCFVFHKEDIEGTYLLLSYAKSRAENQVRVRNSNNRIKDAQRNTSRCTLIGCSLKGVMMSKTPLSVWKGWANSSLVSWAAWYTCRCS
jgi:hypothetical protein